LAVIDLVAINAALFATLILRQDFQPDLVPGAQSINWFVILSVLWLAVALFVDVYSLARAASAWHSFWTSAAAVLLTDIVYLLIPYVTPPLPAARLNILSFIVLTTLAVGAWRVFYASVFVQPGFHQRALVVGAGMAGRTLAQAVAATAGTEGNPFFGTGYQLIGFIDDDAEKQDSSIEGVPVVGTRRDLFQLARALHPDEIVLAVTNSQNIHDELFQAILECSEAGIRITTMSALYETITGQVPVEHAGQDLTVVLPLRQSATHRFYLLVRRLTDIAVGLVGLLITFVLIAPVIWLANKFSSPGPLLYSQARVGEGGRAFQVVKFRSMISDAEKETGAVWAQVNDTRITPVGRLMRRTRLDELPQVWNILRGDMTLIGPRPERPEFVRQLTEQVPFYRLRHAVKPGLSGWAQINYQYGASVKDAQIKLQYDLYYIKHRGPLLDITIALKSMQVILGLKGR
jgi:exopolysaccharide biosynthesis polyprenyl glycosylphosphotransferase